MVQIFRLHLLALPLAIVQQDLLLVKLCVHHNVQLVQLALWCPRVTMVLGDHLVLGPVSPHAHRLRPVAQHIHLAPALGRIMSLAPSVTCSAMLEDTPVHYAAMVYGIRSRADVIVRALPASLLATWALALALITLANNALCLAMEITPHTAPLASAAMMDNGVSTLDNVKLLVPRFILTLSASLLGTVTMLITITVPLMGISTPSGSHLLMVITFRFIPVVNR
jgi:hypothetical protein